MTLVLLRPNIFRDSRSPIVGISFCYQFALASIPPEVGTVKKKVHIIRLFFIADGFNKFSPQKVCGIVNEPEEFSRLLFEQQSLAPCFRTRGEYTYATVSIHGIHERHQRLSL